MPSKANFTAGPALLPKQVEENLRRATFDFGGTGLPIWSISHRSSTIEKMCGESIELVKELLDVPKGYSVLFVSGGATTQFKSWILNFGGGVKTIGYIDSGHWSNEAIKAARELEAHNFCSVRILASSAKDKYRSIPLIANDECHKCDFVHFTANETANGTQLFFEHSPQYGGGTWVADMTSDIFSRRIPVMCFGLIYAGAQKNLGIAGTTMVIIRDDLIDDTWHKALPAPLSYAEQKKGKGALRNTPDTLALCGVYYTLQWIKKQGGVGVMEKRSRERAKALYDAVDKNTAFESIAQSYARSNMNVLFRLRDVNRHEAFLRLCTECGIVGIKGHAGADKHYGPHLRASLYNGQTMENVNLLVDLMDVFERRN